MGEGVGQGVGVGRRVILVFLGVWQGTKGAGGFLAGQVFVLGVCEKGGRPPGVGVVWRCWCEAGVPCVACLLWTWS